MSDLCVGDALFRIEVWAYMWDADGRGHTLHTDTEVDVWIVDALTPSGMWLVCNGRRVWRKANTLFAHKTLEAARESLVYRKARALSFATVAVDKAKAVYARAKAIAEKGEG